MTITCDAPDPTLGVAIRLAGYLDCQSRALGENGFQALAGSPTTTALLTAAITIFVALIGYRLILGSSPSLADGVGWAVKLGIVLTLVTSWPAFQTLVYRVVTDTPGELAGLILPAAGVPTDDLDRRVEAVYDRVRMGLPGTTTTLSNVLQPIGLETPTVPGAPGLSPLPRAASLFVVATTGLTAALRLASGFLLALGPLAGLCLLFRATAGLFENWLRALTALTLATLAAIIATAVELVLIESELARLNALQQGGGDPTGFDPQSITTLILVFVGLTLVSVIAAWFVAGAIRLPRARQFVDKGETSRPEAPWRSTATSPSTREDHMATATLVSQRSRTTSVAEALSAAAMRDTQRLSHSVSTAPSSLAEATVSPVESGPSTVTAGLAGRRLGGRRTQSARRRDALP